jgi:cytochrome P450
MPQIPREGTLDSSHAPLSEGYPFISNRCRRLGSDVFETRLMLRRAICVMGEEAARMFYHPGRFTRRGAMPPTALLLLQDRGSVSVLDGGAHRRRKAMFMSLMTPAALERLADGLADQWHAAIRRWEAMDRVVLHTEVERINILRPTVAVARFITFGALALHENPESRERLRAGDEEYLEWFVQEVRRFYPFFPLVGGRAREAFEWRGTTSPKGLGCSWTCTAPTAILGSGRSPRRSGRSASARGTGVPSTSFPRAGATTKTIIGAPASGSPSSW